jgi:hypothetical protein
MPADPKPLRPTTPIPVEIVDELWITASVTGEWLLSNPLVVNRTTGIGAPGLLEGQAKVLRPGTVGACNDITRKRARDI